MLVSINAVLNNAYKKEKDSNVKERILLVKRVKIDKQEAASVAEHELNRSRWWAYKWLHRFDKDGLDGLKDQPRCFEYEDEQGNDCSTLTLAAGENKLCTVKNYISSGVLIEN